MVYQLGPADPHERPEYLSEPSYAEELPRSRGLWMKAALALVVMAVFSGGLWFAYKQGARSAGSVNAGSVPLIRADDRPTRMKPDNPGGMDIPDQDKTIFDQKGVTRPPGGERLLPAPEKPLPRPTAPPPMAAAAPSAASLGPGSGSAAAPGVSENPAPGPAASSSPSAAKPIPPKPDASKPGSSKQDAAVKTDGKKVEAAASATPNPAAAKPAGASGGAVRLQLGSVRNEEAARTEWERVKRANPDLLGSMTASALRIDLGEKGVHYRIQAGPVGDAAAAEKVCGELKKRNVGCLVSR